MVVKTPILSERERKKRLGKHKMKSKKYELN